jgi:hypothetical protein
MWLIDYGVSLFIRTITWVTELFLSRRGMSLCFLGAAALFAASGWLRPPLSPDIRGLHMPLNIIPGAGASADEVLVGSRHLRFDSIGALLLSMIAFSALATLWRPKSLSLWAGLLLATSIACTGMAMFNCPVLIELLDGEMIQREQLGSILRHESELSLAANSPIRTAPLRMPKTDNAPEIEEFPEGSLFRAWIHMLYGPWLVATAMFVVLINVRGSWDRRLGVLGLWASGGLLAGALLCAPRLMAEGYWNRAQNAEREGDLVAARQNIDKAVELFPEFQQLGRTWYLLGKLDYRESKQSLELLYFNATQLAYQNNHVGAQAFLDQLLAAGGDAYPAVRHLAGLVEVDTARTYVAKGLIVPAADSFRRAIEFAPYRVDAVFGLSTTLSFTDRDHPEMVEAQLGPLVARVGDRALRADLLERIADAFFQAGNLEVARKYYQDSIDMFCQPKFVNLPAQAGMLGM